MQGCGNLFKLFYTMYVEKFFTGKFGVTFSGRNKEAVGLMLLRRVFSVCLSIAYVRRDMISWRLLMTFV